MKRFACVFGILLLAQAVGQVVGCMEPKTPSLLDQCADEARAAYYVGDASVEEAMRIYEVCKSRSGVH